MKHVKQPTDYTCMSACISMVTGIDVELVIAEFGNQYANCTGYSGHLVYKYLIQKGFVPLDVNETMKDGRIAINGKYNYIVTLASLSDKDAYHAIVISTINGCIEVFDPMLGVGLCYKTTDWDEIRESGIWFDVAINF